MPFDEEFLEAEAATEGDVGKEGKVENEDGDGDVARVDEDVVGVELEYKHRVVCAEVEYRFDEYDVGLE